MLPRRKSPSDSQRQITPCYPIRQGATTIEFAIVFPIVLTFFLSLVTFVQLFIIRNAAENAAYFGAREGILAGSTVGDIESTIKEEIKLGLISTYQSDITRTGDSVTVTVNVPLMGNAWATGSWAPSGISIQQSCTLQKQEK